MNTWGLKFSCSWIHYLSFIIKFFELERVILVFLNILFFCFHIIQIQNIFRIKNNFFRNISFFRFLGWFIFVNFLVKWGNGKRVLKIFFFKIQLIYQVELLFLLNRIRKYYFYFISLINSFYVGYIIKIFGQVFLKLSFKNTCYWIIIFIIMNILKKMFFNI